jgi:hypothetical protein
MSQYLELPTYDFLEMTSEEKRVILKDFNQPIVIRGLYQSKAMQMSSENIVKLFGDSKLPIEFYDTPETRFYDSGTGTATMKGLFEHWKTDKLPILYCAEVDLFKQNMSELLLETFRNPNTEPKKVEALMLYLGKNWGSDLHIHIRSDFILNQVFGSKTVYIFSNYDNLNINKNSSFDMDKFNTPKEDFFSLDHSQMKIYKVTLQPGDSLLIPPWYWHATRGHGINMSITQIYIRNDMSYLLTNPNIIIDYMIFYPEILYVLVIFIMIILTFHHVR